MDDPSIWTHIAAAIGTALTAIFGKDQWDRKKRRSGYNEQADTNTDRIVGAFREESETSRKHFTGEIKTVTGAVNALGEKVDNQTTAIQGLGTEIAVVKDRVPRP